MFGRYTTGPFSRAGASLLQFRMPVKQQPCDDLSSLFRRREGGEDGTGVWYNTTMNPDLVVIGGGLAGTEASWQAAQRGLRVRLFEMRPEMMTGAHATPYLAELDCSNS
jgi:NADPH-dependent 2,4-dienoyl-CoA reductase/sulfur reductase-like enzyme